jgi:hypothetical protein
VTARPVLAGGCVAADPVLSTVAILPPPAGCQYLFNPNGSLAGITAVVELADDAGAPIAGQSVVASFVAVPGSGMKSCPNHTEGSAMTNALGVAMVTFDTACGCGPFNLAIISFCDVSTIVLHGTFGPFDGTSPDLNGSCNVPGPNPVNVVDLGIWAGCLGAPALCCDYTCDGLVDILDLAIWASGLFTSCF